MENKKIETSPNMMKKTPELILKLSLQVVT